MTTDTASTKRDKGIGIDETTRPMALQLPVGSKEHAIILNTRTYSFSNDITTFVALLQCPLVACIAKCLLHSPSSPSPNHRFLYVCSHRYLLPKNGFLIALRLSSQICHFLFFYGAWIHRDRLFTRLRGLCGLVCHWLHCW